MLMVFGITLVEVTQPNTNNSRVGKYDPTNVVLTTY